MENIIKKVYKSRNTILEIYDNLDWDTSKVPILGIEELEDIFNTYNTSDSIIQTFGDGMAFSFKIPHKIIENHNLAVIYYNFNSSDKKSQKVTKSLIDKIENLYTTDYLNNDDSLLIIINEPQTQSTDKLMHAINHKINDKYNLSEYLEKYIYINDNTDQDKKYNRNYFRFCTIMSIDMYQVNLLKHELVPEHIIINNPKEKENIFRTNNVTINQLPIINKYDNIAKLIRINSGDICKIIRRTENYGNTIYYRICR